MAIIDLSQVMKDQMQTYPEDPQTTLTQIATFGSHGYTAHLISTGLHTGTHIDAPAHMIPGGKKITEIPLERFAGHGFLIDAREREQIDESCLANLPEKIEYSIVLILTGWSRYFGESAYFAGHPTITEGFARAMIQKDVSMIGLDMPSPDVHPFPIHTLLLSHDILIAENLTNLDLLLKAERIAVAAYPLSIEAEAAPARITATI